MINLSFVDKSDWRNRRYLSSAFTLELFYSFFFSRLNKIAPKEHTVRRLSAFLHDCFRKLTSLRVELRSVHNARFSLSRFFPLFFSVLFLFLWGTLNALTRPTAFGKIFVIPPSGSTPGRRWARKVLGRAPGRLCTVNWDLRELCAKSSHELLSAKFRSSLLIPLASPLFFCTADCARRKSTGKSRQREFSFTRR